MTLNLNDRERQLLNEVKQKALDFDIEFAVRMCAHALIKLTNRERVTMIHKILDLVDDALLNAAARCGSEAVTQRHGVDTDTNIDIMRNMMEAHNITSTIMRLIESASMEGNDTEAELLALPEEKRVGVLTPEYKTLDKALESIRLEIVRKRGEFLKEEARRKRT